MRRKFSRITVFRTIRDIKYYLVLLCSSFNKYSGHQAHLPPVKPKVPLPKSIYHVKYRIGQFNGLGSNFYPILVILFLIFNAKLSESHFLLNFFLRSREYYHCIEFRSFFHKGGSFKQNFSIRAQTFIAQSK